MCVSAHTFMYTQLVVNTLASAVHVFKPQHAIHRNEHIVGGGGLGAYGVVWRENISALVRGAFL